MSATDSTGRRGAEPAWAREAERTAGVEIVPGRAYGFFTDTTLCIGCKACEVACKQWNNLPAEGFHFTGVSYDNTRALSATTWRHVRFIEQFDERDPGDVGPAAAGVGDRARRRDGAAVFGGDRTLSPAGGGRMTEREDGASDGAGDRAGPVAYRQTAVGDRDAGPPMPDFPTGFEPWGHLGTDEQWAKPGARWLLMSDVCKHCVHAPCLEACPTGSIIRTEFDSVYIQQDVCNGCGYCVPACPFAVVEVDREGTGKAHKCTLCYDRLKDGLEPACSKACPTDSIRFGPVDELLERARVRVAELRARGIPAYLYGSGGVLEDDCDTSALGGLNCFFLLIDRPEVYNLPPVAKRPSANTGVGLAASALAALALAGAVLAAFRAGRGEGGEGPANGPIGASV